MSLTAREIGQRAQAQRKRAKLTQQTVAVHFKVDKATVSRWETGETEIHVSRIIEMARLYDCSPYAILLDPADADALPPSSPADSSDSGEHEVVDAEPTEPTA